MNGVALSNKAFQRDAIAVSHLLHNAQKLRHGNSAPEQRRYGALKFSSTSMFLCRTLMTSILAIVPSR
jgi:hypothetical protein